MQDVVGYIIKSRQLESQEKIFNVSVIEVSLYRGFDLSMFSIKRGLTNEDSTYAG